MRHLDGEEATSSLRSTWNIELVLDETPARMGSQFGLMDWKMLSSKVCT
jgi:hypothetical protein